MNSIIFRLKPLWLVLALSFVTLAASAKDVIYVKSGASGGGSSWSDAIGNIQQAVDLAAQKGADVWVAKGVYKSDSSVVVKLKPNVSLYGGFAGGETSLAARDTAKNATVLDGDGKSQVLYQVSDFEDASAVVVDGFTIRNGTASNGGGAYLQKNSTLNNCILKNNTATDFGLAIYATNAKVKNCIISDNTTSGTAYRTVFLNASEMDGCVVKNNTAYSCSGIYVYNSSVVSNTTIDSNKNIYAENESPLYLNLRSKLIDCVVTNNYGRNAGVCAYNESLVKGCSFSKNTSTANSLIHIQDYSKIEDSEIFDNRGIDFEIVYVYYVSYMNRCKVYNNVVDNDHYIVNIRTSSVLSNSLIYGNKNVKAASAPLCLYSANMINTTFADNETGAEYSLRMNSSSVINSIIVGTKHTGSFRGHVLSVGSNTFRHSMIEGGVWGEGNITGTKELAAFTDPEKGDYSLSEKSYCINRGQDVQDTIDLTGNARKQNGAVDMGAIESRHAMVQAPTMGDILYVKQGSKGDGSSWSSALGDVNEAIRKATLDGRRHQIWVAAGTYFGDSTSSISAFSLERGIDLYGGFAGNETSLSARDTAKNPTILDGRSTKRVIYQNYGFPDSLAVVVDGFTIQNGVASYGGGVNVSSNVTIDNCIIKNNKATDRASAIYAQKSTIKNSQIIGNTYSNNLYYTVWLIGCEMKDCVLKDNKATYNSGIYAEESTVSSCTIEGNSSYRNGNRGSYFVSTTVSDCRFVNAIGEGAAVELQGSTLLTRCLFDGNSNCNTVFMYIGSGNARVEDCQIINNTVNSDLMISYGKLNRCQIKGNTVTGRIAEIRGTSAAFSNCLICDNVSSSTSYEPIYLRDGAAMINCTVVHNETKCGYAVALLNSMLKNSIVVDNRAANNYSGVLNANGTNTVTNNMIGSSYVDGVDGMMRYVAFTDAENGDYSLSENSNCINAGVDVADSLDLLGNARKQGGTVDLGAIESAYTKSQTVVPCGDVVYVKQGSNGDGSSWQSAFGDVQQAIAAASTDGKKHQIWVAAGTYYGDTTLSSVVSLVGGISLYGGFAGTETSLSARDVAKNPTVLDGMHGRCVISQNYDFIDSLAVVVDGFTIQNGYAVYGGGMNINANATVNNCIIKDNSASVHGSAIYAKRAVIKNSLIEDNSYVGELSYTIWLGGCVMDSCEVKNNKTYTCSAIYSESNAKISNCVIEGNTSSKDNYCGSYFQSSRVDSCKFVNTEGSGASVSLGNASVMRNCLIKGNTNAGANIVNVGGGNALMEDCQILDNSSKTTLISSNGKISRCLIKGNTSSSRVVSLNYGSAALFNSLVCDNVSTSDGPLINLYDYANMINCTVVRNETKGSNIIFVEGSTLKNSIVVGNKMNELYSSVLGTSRSNTIVNNMLEGTFVEGNINGSMKYADFTDAENGDYSLSANSYCINAGVDISDTLDLLGKVRKQGGAVDMGAIESAHTSAPSITCTDTVYVKLGSNGDGSSWDAAFGDIQQAIFAASSDNRNHQIWVAAGTYYGDTTLPAVVTLASGISLYGGFAGNETSLEARDVATNPTILDGENKKCVISQSFGFPDAKPVVVDGFTIQNGYAANGAGVNINANTTINNCILKNNIANNSGALRAESARVTNSVLVGNESYGGDVFYLVGTTMSDCKIINNVNSKGSGYIIHMRSNSVVDRCLIDGNETQGYVLCDYGNSLISNSQITKCKSRGNYLIAAFENSRIFNCTVADNESRYQTVYCFSNTQVLNSIVVGNKRLDNSASVGTNGNVMIRYSMIEGGANGEGNVDGSKSSAAFTDAAKGDYSLSETSFCINAGTDVADTLDMLGNERKQSNAVDMGAIESSFSERATVGSIIYVKAGAEGSGLNWDDALGEINQAVTLASTTGKKHQIWVASGTYYGDTTLSSAISLAAGVSLYGGFAGTESSLDERNVAENATVIDGQYKRRCIIQNYDFADSLAIVVDGFTIQNGFLRNNNGMNVKSKKNVTFIGCSFNNAKDGEESVFAEKSEFRNCKFIGNSVQSLELNGGVVDSCLFINNSDGRGYRIVSLRGSVMSNSRLSGQSTTYGVLEATGQSVVSSCEISKNISTYSNVIYLSNSLMENSLVYGNEARNVGYCIISHDYNSSIINSTIAHNTTKDRCPIYRTYTSTDTRSTIANSIIYGNKVRNAVVPQVVSSDYLKVMYCASDDELSGENNIRLATANSGSDASQNYVCFINAAGGDYRLHATSSCVDKGLDSLMTAKTDINGSARIYGKSIDLGAFEFDGEYIQMLDYGQVVCHNSYSLEATFDSTIATITWEIARAGNVTGYESTSGSGTSIPSMKLRTSGDNIDTMILMVTPYDKAGVASAPFNYNYYVYPDLSEKKVTFASPRESYVVNEQDGNMTIDWRLSLPVEVEKYDLYVWKAAQSMPSAPMASYVNNHYQTLSDLDNHTTYKYMVAAILSCDTIYSDIDSFRIEIPVSLEINGSSVCELGTKLNATTSSRRSVKGFELQDSISYTISGTDAADFSVQLSDNWNALTGGSYNVYFTPTDANKPLSSATLTFQSGTHTAVMDLKGILANYYVFDAVVEKEVYKAGDSITIKGSVSDAFGNPLEGKRLKVSLRKGDSEIRTYEVVSDADGKVEVVYASTVFESGVYSVGVCLSGESSDVTYDEFDIPGISCSVGMDKWVVQKGDTIRGTITVRNLSNVVASNVKVNTLALANGCKVEFDSIAVLNGLESKTISFYVTGESVTEGNRYLMSTFRVETAEGLMSSFTSYFYCEMPYGQIKVMPSTISAYVSKQKNKYVELLLCNTGIGETGKVTVALPNNFEGMSMPSGTVIESIKPGDTVKATLKLSYFDGAKLNTPYSGTIGFNCENGKSTSISYTMEYTSSLVGSVSVDVVDEYYYNSSSKNHLAGATVEIRNAFNSAVVASGVTDVDGKVRFDKIPEGDYSLIVNADKHSGHKETITVQAGQTLNKFVFVSYQAVTYTWNVERTEIEDKYNLDIEAKYETNVPAPVVTAEFPDGLPKREDFAPGTKYVANLLITNHGMIAAKNVSIETPAMKYFKFTPDVDHIDSLPANYSVVVPVTIERLSEQAPSGGDGQSGSGYPNNDNTGIGYPYLFYYPTVFGGGSFDNNAGVTTNVGGYSGGSTGTDDSVDSPDEGCFLYVIYFYDCEIYIKKLAYVKLWDCLGHLLEGGYFSFHGGSWHVGSGASSTVEFDCDRDDDDDDDDCEEEIDGGFSCFMDIVGWIPAFGDLIEGGYRGASNTWKTVKKVSKFVKDEYDVYSATGSAVDAWGDALSNGMSARNVVSHVYDAGTIAFGFIPVVGDFVPFGCLDWWCQAHSCEQHGKFASNCGEFIYDDIKEFSDLIHGSHMKAAPAGATDFYKSASPYLLAWHDVLELSTFEIYRSRCFAELIGADDEMMKKVGLTDYLDFAISAIAYRNKIDIEEVKKLPVSDLSLTDMIAISERWNRTVDAWNAGVFASNEEYPNIADKSVVDKYVDGITNFYQYVVFRGFEDISDMIDFINAEMTRHNTPRKGVCASVKLHISQTMTMTREAFDGTLTVNNGNETSDMNNFTVALEIRDEKGNLANDLFQINTQSLSGIDAVDGSSKIGAGEEITALFRFIPEKGAAPKTPVNYSFGGKIIYLDAGDTVTINLDPVTLTVNPSPDLQIDYFMQRNILGDDALTQDRVEPSVPAALGVRIDNQGYGDAKNVKLETAQPEIVDNEKGLLIDFSIIGSSLNGKDCDLGSENIDFGNIEAQSAKTGVWWMTSSLLGHFTKYEASVVHANSYGNPDLSLVKGVAIHELIKTVDAYGSKEDGVTDFLVNDTEDSYDTPDAIYYSDGGMDPVYRTRSIKLDKDRVTLADTVVKLTVMPSEEGWNYAQTSDPGDNCYDIQKVVRVKDGVEIPLSNVWTTFVTLLDGAEPIYENRLHFLDYLSKQEETDYNIYYSQKKNLLEVTEISGIPTDEGSIARTPVESVVVKFNRKIQKESFDYKDIELYCQAGDNLSDSTIKVSQRDDYTYVVNISSKTKVFGHYKIEVNVNNVYDEAGYPGEYGRSATWVQYLEGEEPGGGDEPGEEPTPIVDVEDGKAVVYAYQNYIYVKSAKAGTLDIYDMLSKLVVKNARYEEGITCVATLPTGVYIINGKKVIVK